MAVGGMQGQTESREMRALTSIDSKRYPDTNKDLERNIARLNSSVDYMAQYMKLMQKGIDEANQDIIEQIQSLISNFVILFAGGTPTGIDMGDLQYIIPVLGALFGLNGPFPMSLIDAASNFFLGYVVPLPQFTDVITDVIIGWAEEIGLSDEAIQALKDFTWAVTDLGMDVIDLVTKIFGIFDIFGILPEGASMGALGTFWNALLELFEGVDTYILKPVLDAISTVAVPIINALTDIVETVDAIVEALGLLTGDVPSIGDFFGNLWNFLDFIDFSSPTFDLSAAASQFVTNILSPTNLLANLVDGFIPDFRIPDLDASKIASGAFSQAQLAIPNVQQIVDNIVQGGGGFGDGHVVDAVRDRIGNIFDTASRADQNVIDIQASVQQLVDDNSAGTSGNSNSVVFTGAEGATLTGFTVRPNFDSIVIRNPGDGSTVTAGLNSAAGDGRVWAVFDTTQYATDDQSVSGVLGRQGSSEVSLTLTNRTDPAMTNGAYVNVTKDQVTVGSWTRTGSTFTYNQLATVSRTTKIGARVEFRAVGTNYYVLVNGVQVLAVTDIANSVTIGATNRCCGFVLARDTLGLFNIVHYSFWPASFAMADYAPGGVSSVAGWHLTRSSTSAVDLSISNGGVAVLPAGFLTLQDSVTDVTVTDLGAGVVEINESDWYEVVAAVMARASDTAIDHWFAPYWALHKNGSQFTGPLSMGVPHKVFLSAGDTVQAGIVGVAALPTSASRTSAFSPGSTDNFGEAVSIGAIKGFASFSGRRVG